MESRIEKAVQNKNNGYNCAQAVACSYCDIVGMDEETMYKVTEALGAGMGGMEGTCGAISGACIVLGLKNSSGTPKMPQSKAVTLKKAREIVSRFKERNKSVTCKDLKGVETGVVLRSCPDCVRDAAEFLEDILAEEA